MAKRKYSSKEVAPCLESYTIFEPRLQNGKTAKCVVMKFKAGIQLPCGALMTYKPKDGIGPPTTLPHEGVNVAMAAGKRSRTARAEKTAAVSGSPARELS